MISHKVIRYAALILLALVALFLILNAANNILSYVPLTSQWHARRAVAKVERLEGQVTTLEREATGNAEIGQAVETYHTREVIVREIAAQATTENGQADDATTPLSEERANRLRAHDRLLCDHTGLCAAPDAASGG